MSSRDPDSREAHRPGPGEAWTPIRLTRWSGDYLGDKGVENGRLDAELLLASVLGVRRLDLYLQYDRPLRQEELDKFKALLKRRASREPLQYILGTTVFRDMELRTDPRALIPRPETEVLVDEVLAWVGARWAGQGVRVRGERKETREGLVGLDLGTGTGAIALSLLKEGPFQRMVATDPSSDALELARENALSSGLLDHLDLRSGSLFEPIRPGEDFHVVVSNPPYVAEKERESLQAEVKGWEPPRALFAGPQGLDVLIPLIRGASGFLKSGGLLALEVGDGQDHDVVQAMEGTGAFSEVQVREDLSGRARVVLGVAPE